MQRHFSPFVVGSLALSLILVIRQAPAQTQIELNTDDQKGLYALGLALAEITGRFQLSPTELEVVTSGLHDGVMHHPRLELNDFRNKIHTMGDLRALQTAREEKKLGLEFQQRALQNPNAVKHPSGMISILEQKGTGQGPSSSSRVKIRFIGSLRDGTEFDRTQDPITVPIRSAPFACLQEALMSMKVGEKQHVICPAELTTGFLHPRVPAGSTLIFDLELLEILEAKAAPLPGVDK